MKILVWGLGYVGTVSAACMAKLGHDVIGIEPNATKANAVNKGNCAIKEPGLPEMVAEAHKCGKLIAVTNGIPEIAKADISLICVGTPNSADGSPHLGYIQKVASDLGQGIKTANNFHVIALRSTVFPGTTRNVLIKIVEEVSGKKAGIDFGVVMNPEFLREGTAVKDFYNPPYTIVGAFTDKGGDVIAKLYENIDAPIHRVPLEEAELLKVTNNVFHALKIGFANEMGRICDSLGMDSHQLMELVCKDTKLNISRAYMKPGFGFGGSCLPKDLRFLTYHARIQGVDVPILNSIMPSNQIQLTAAHIKLQKMNVQTIGILGLSFKAETDDLRESPVIPLIRDLWQEGKNILVHDPDVVPEDMVGTNRDYLERQLPQIHDILKKSIRDVIENSDVIVVTQKRALFTKAIADYKPNVKVLDLVRMADDPNTLGFSNYTGMSW